MWQHTTQGLKCKKNNGTKAESHLKSCFHYSKTYNTYNSYNTNVTYNTGITYNINVIYNTIIVLVLSHLKSAKNYTGNGSRETESSGISWLAFWWARDKGLMQLNCLREKVLYVNTVDHGNGECLETVKILLEFNSEL